MVNSQQHQKNNPMASFNYDKAFDELKTLLEEIQAPDTSLEDLSKKLKRAKELVKKCKAKLRQIEADVEQTLEEE